MNKIFKVIWSKARNCYVVVSEIAHCQGKGKGQKRAVLTCSLAAALTVFTLTGGITAVQAAQTQTINITEESPGAQGSTNEGTYSTVIGPGAKNKSNQSEGVIVIGHNAIVDNNGSPKDSIAIGTSANVVGENNIAIGTKAAVTNNGGNNAISLGTEATAEKSESIAIGMKAHANNNDGIAAIAIGSGSQAQKDKSIAIGYKTLAENNGESGGIAIGSSIVDSQGNIITQTKAAQGNDIAFGVGAQTNNRNMNGHNGGAIAIGHLSYSNGNQDVAIGDNAKTGRHESEGEGYVAIGANSFSNVGPGVVGYDFKTNGSHNIQTNEDAAAWKSTNGAVSVGNVSDSDHTKWITRQITGVAAGSNNTDAVNVAQLKAAIDSVKPGGGSGTGGDGVHYYSVLSDETGDGSNYDNNGAKGKNSLAAGVSASATEKAENAVAIGYKAKAEGKGATVIGQYGTATGRYALAFGGQQTDTSSVAANNVASGDNSVAFGERSTASGSNSTAFGQETKATEKRATAFGQRTQATQSNATAFGIDTIASGQNATAFGNLTQATEIGATAFGNKNQATGQYATAWGGGDKVVTNNDGTTKEVGTVASGTYATAFGERTVASGESATAFGSDSTAEGKNSLAFGEGSNALGGNSLAGLGGTAAADDSIALGRNAQARSKDTLAIGNGAKALTGKDVAIGYGAEASSNLTDTSTYNYPAIAIGDGTSVKASESVAIGKANVIERADGEADLAGANILGHNNTVKASGVAVIGNNNSVTDPRNHDVMILGNLVTKTTDNSVFLGSGSAYTSESESTKGKSKTYTSDRIGGATLTYAGGAVTSGIVSVGSPDATRRIQNVAPGLLTSASTDAVNGSQLYAVANVAAKNTEILGKGLKFKGDNDTVITKKLDEQLDIVGGADAKKLTDKNIGVNNVGGQLKIQLAKDIDLTKSGSVKMGDTTINNTGLTIHGGPSITQTHIDAGSKTIINVAPGENGTDAVNVNQLNEVKNVASAHTTVSVGGQKAQKDGKEVKGGNLVLTRTQDAATHAYNYDVKLGNDITVGEKSADGKDGKISVNGKDGSSVVINGKDGTIGLNGQNGTNGLTIRGAAGKDGITRIVYKDAAGKDHPVATLDDGLKFKGDTGDVISKKLNDTLTIKGGQTDASKLSDGKNVGVINEKGALRIELAKKIDLSEDGSVKMGDTTINNNGLTIKNGPTITKTNVSMNNQQIHNVAAGKKGTDAVNVDQLNEVQTLASKHTKVTVEGGTAPKGQTYVGKNLKINVTNSNGQETYDLKLADNLSIGEKGAEGKDGKIGVNGKDGSSVVINGKDGTIGLNGKNGTNGLTIRGAAGKPGVDGKDGITRIVYKDAAGKDHPVATLEDGLNFKGDDSTVISKKLNQRMDIVGGANENNLSENNIGVISDNGKLHVKLAKDLKGLTSVTTTDGNGNTTVQNGKGVTVKDSQNNTSIFTAKDITFTNRDKSHKTKLDEDGLIIFTKGTSGQANQTIKITNTYISMGGQQIHNVLAGKADTDAVNVSQLKAVQSVAEAHSTVSVGGKKAGKDSVDVKGGNLVLKRTENTNGSKNYDVKLADDISIKSVKTTDDKGNKTVQKGGGITTIDKDGNKTSVTGKGVTTVDKEGNKTSLTGKGMTTVDKEGNKTSVTGKGVSISGKDGNKTTITEKGLTIKGGPIITKDKFSAGGQQIHDVVAGTADTDAVNVSQLKEEIGKVEQHHTEVTVNGGTEAQEGTYNTSGNLQIKKTTDKDTGKKTYDLKLADKLTFGAKDGADGKEGVDGSIGVNGRNGSAVVINGQDGSIGLNGANGENGLTIKGANGTVGVDGKAGTTRLIYETKDGETTVKHEVATMDDGMKYSGDSGNAAVKLNKNVQVYGGATEYADGNNIGVVASQDGDNAKLQVKLAKDLKGINSIEAKTITTGDTTMDNSGLTVKGDGNHKDITIHQGNVNMGGNKIEGVAPGKVSKDSTDAVNGSQLWQRDQAINGLSGSVNKLGNRINRVGAGAAALAALHPLDFDPDDKWDFAAGYGNYRGANAAAVGAYYRPNEDTMFSVGGSFGGGENMVNAGVSIKLGQGNHVSTSRVAMAKEIKDLRQNVANLNAIVNRQSALIDKLTGTNAGMIKDKGNDLFPDVPANHWAYEYVTKLKHAGILTGYPDGNFDGDRMMTRYEFAAIVYRAIMAGAASNPALNQDGTLDKLANEFSSEMKYIRIDTIAKDKNGKPTIERVRVISDAK